MCSSDLERGLAVGAVEERRLADSTALGRLATPEEVAENVALFATPIPPAFWSDLKAQNLLARDAPTP